MSESPTTLPTTNDPLWAFAAISGPGRGYFRYVGARADFGNVADKMDSLVAGCAQNVPTRGDSEGENIV